MARRDLLKIGKRSRVSNVWISNLLNLCMIPKIKGFRLIQIYSWIYAISWMRFDPIPKVTESVAGTYILGMQMRVGDLVVWRSEGLMACSRSSLGDVLLLMSHSNKVPYYHVTTFLCYVIMLLCHVRDHTTIVSSHMLTFSGYKAK